MSTSQRPGPSATKRSRAPPSRSPVSRMRRPADSTATTKLDSLSVGPRPRASSPSTVALRGWRTRTLHSPSKGISSPFLPTVTAIPAWLIRRRISVTAGDSLFRNASGTTTLPTANLSIRSGTPLKWSVSACEITSVSIRSMPSLHSTAERPRPAAIPAPSRPASYTRQPPPGPRITMPQPCPIAAITVSSAGAVRPGKTVTSNPTQAQAAAAPAQVNGRTNRGPATRRRIASIPMYQPAIHHPGGPLTHAKAPGIPAACRTTTSITARLASHTAPPMAASGTHTGLSARQTNPPTIASPTSGAISGLSSNPTGLATWNEPATNGAVASHTAAPTRTASAMSQPRRRNQRSTGPRE